MENDQHAPPSQSATPSTASTLKKLTTTVTSAVVAEQIFHPLDTAIRRIQVFNQKLDSIEKVNVALFGKAGKLPLFPYTKSLFDGFVSSSVYKMMTRPYKFFLQPYAEAQMEKKIGPLTQNYIDEKKSKIIFNAATGAITGLGEISIFYPLDSIKIKRQIWDQRHWPQIIREEKFSLYKGFDSAAWRNVIGSAILFSGYDAIMALFGRPQKPTTTQKLVSSSLAAVLSSVLTNPFDVVKTRMQAEKNEKVAEKLSLSMINAGQKKTNYSGFFSTAKKIIKQEGVFALGKGSVLKCLRAWPSLAAPLFMYNMIPQWWDEHHPSQKLNENSNVQSHTIKK